MASVLEIEQRTLESKLPELVKEHENQFVVVRGTGIWRFFESEDQAIRAGRKEFGREPFLVALVTTRSRTIDLSTLLLGHPPADAH